MNEVEETGCCGICGVDPIEHFGIEIGVTLVDMCAECYATFLNEARTMNPHIGLLYAALFVIVVALIFWWLI